MGDNEFLGSFEQLVLLAVVRLRDDAYGMTVRRELEERTVRSVSLGAVYATLDRLEKKGFVKSAERPGGVVRNGRAKRFFRIESQGMAALERSLQAIEAMSHGLRGTRGRLGEIR